MNSLFEKELTAKYVKRLSALCALYSFTSPQRISKTKTKTKTKQSKKQTNKTKQKTKKIDLT